MFLVFGLGLSIGTLLVLAFIIQHGSAPTLFGIEFLDGNSLVGRLWGLNTVVALGLALVAVGVIEMVAGFWLWQSSKKGGKLGIVLLIPNLFFAVGFGIPALYVVSLVTTVLLGLGWKNLR